MRAYFYVSLYYARQLSRCFIKIIIFNPGDKPFFFFLHETTGSLSDLVKVTQYESWTSVSPARGLSTKVTLHVQVSIPPPTLPTPEPLPSFNTHFSLKHLIWSLGTLYQNIFLHLVLHFSLHVNFLLFLEFSLPWFPSNPCMWLLTSWPNRLIILPSFLSHVDINSFFHSPCLNIHSVYSACHREHKIHNIISFP